MSDQTLKLIEAATYLAFFFIGLAITIWVKPWLAAKTSVEKTNFLYNMADTLVKAAEQLQGPGAGLGPSKFDYVFSALRGLSDSHGINASTETILAAIEAAVHEMNAGKTSAPAAAAVGNVVVAAPEAAIVATNGNSNGG